MIILSSSWVHTTVLSTWCIYLILSFLTLWNHYYCYPHSIDLDFWDNSIKYQPCGSKKEDISNKEVTVIKLGSDQISSVAQSCPTLRPYESQHARPPRPSPIPRVHWDSRPSSQWCHPAISSSVIPFSSCPQSLPPSKSFPMSQFFAWGGQSTGVSALASFLPRKSQGWSPLKWTGWISLQSKGLSRVFSNTTVQKHQFLGAQPSSQSNSHIHSWPQEKP